MKNSTPFIRLVSLSIAFLSTSLFAQDAAKKEEEPKTLILITNVSVWDGTSDRPTSGVEVLVENNKIKTIGKDIEAAGATVIDGKGGYLPDNDEELTHLGAEQWAWLDKELQKPADLRLICSGTQVIPDQKGMDEWGNFPHERRRLIDLARTAGNAVLLGSNVHFAEISRDDSTGILELTSSGMTHINEIYGAAPNRYRIGEPMVALNFGLIEIDWQEQTMPLDAAGLAGKLLIQHTVSLDDLSP